MSQNPYSPPAADVADLNRTQAFPPRRVYGACVLILAALVLGVLALLPGIRVPDEQPIPLWFTLAVVVVFGGITVWFAIEVLRGKNWARWAMLVYLLVGWLLGGTEIPNTFTESPLAAIIEMVCMAMEALACWLLSSGASAQWFREIAERRSVGANGP